MRVLITGGYGFLGAWIIKNLLARFDRVWVYDLKEDPRRLTPIMPAADVAKVVFVEGDVTNQDTFAKALAKHQISHLIHLAGLQVPTCRANPILGAKVNVVGTLCVFEAVRLAGDQIKRLVYASTAAVFGPPEKYPSGPLADDVKLFPATHYGHFKVCNEGNAAVYFQDFGLSSVGLRPWTVYGVGRDLGMTSEPTKAIKAVALGRKYHITYGGIQDLQYVDDVAKAFVQCLEAPYKGSKSYNLRGAVVDIQTFHKALCNVEPSARELVTHGDRQLTIAYDLDDAAILRDIGPLPKTPLEDGIRQTLAIFRQLAKEGRLDTSDLDAPVAPPAAVKGDEP
ncbi:MAG TPA: NAD(P)-dependent oxidoreductase [Gemmataceae bacterium]|jgi:nucleoside-diphosphate-sugar epimerase|nr:NAD(P)-dependent oxidoreductase [Gemmataceae bacterium]